MMLSPCQVHKFRICASTQNLSVTILKLAIQFSECRDFSGANESEVFRPEEIYLPLTGIAILMDVRERGLQVRADGSLHGKNGETLSNT
jgi:hypothetical protein